MKTQQPPKKPQKTQRTKDEIGKDIVFAYKHYKGLKPGSPAFRNISRRLESLSKEMEEAKR